MSNLDTARRYLNAIEAGADPDALANFFALDVTQVEYPNRLVPNGATRDLAALLEGSRRGKQAVSAQRYDIQRAFEIGVTVILEVLWTGILAIPVGSIPVGGEMRAHFAVFIDFRDGKIVRQHNYDCFEPW